MGAQDNTLYRGVLRFVALAILFTYTSRSGATQPSTSDGIFTHAQAAEGEKAFTISCASCHASDLTGKPNAPALAGDSFVQRWQGHSVGEFFVRISTTMPKGQPHSLDDTAYANIIAFLFEANGYVPGRSELKAELGVLNQTIIGLP
jgi:quinoprotein glucose dehydrogenase